VLFAVLWTSPVSASPFTVSWAGFDFIRDADEQPPSPFYDCFGWSAGGLHCEWLWESGLKVSKSPGYELPMYGDGGPFYDLYGIDVTDFLPDFSIQAECLAGIAPCFHTFTPRDIWAYGANSTVGLFFGSSRGGRVIVPPGASGHVSFDGPEWTDITAMWVGIYVPEACMDPELDCSADELALGPLTFDATPIPEPVSTLLVGAGLLAVLSRRRRHGERSNTGAGSR
jgi:hypothetical protein